ncbi:hypothetical protein DLAC_08574 [Tieghemostelium lacteum]|uniref:EGF-like domain-containing protein n=1 Tax=Tieghemostelium lacteum TaxID=361077 RepID=A0A151Z7R8_TIELA|nr:hypothetical protein DLAC_08574 [Tieghemostelium lacteum]|eukprot:KYQ90001.1 hypothetical protein DLAC_08574 [Tieghemostelium lacteum]
MIKYTYLFILLLSYIIGKCYSYVLVDQTPPFTNHKYSETIQGCEFTYLFTISSLASDPDLTNCNAISSPIPFVSKELSVSARSCFFNIIASVPRGTGVVTINLQDIGDFNQTLSYICEDPPHPIINSNPDNVLKPYGDFFVVNMNLNLLKRLPLESNDIVIGSEAPFVCNLIPITYSLYQLNCTVDPSKIGSGTTFLFSIRDSTMNLSIFEINGGFLLDSRSINITTSWNKFDPPDVKLAGKQNYVIVDINNCTVNGVLMKSSETTQILLPKIIYGNPNEYILLYNRLYRTIILETLTLVYYTENNGTIAPVDKIPNTYTTSLDSISYIINATALSEGGNALNLKILFDGYFPSFIYRQYGGNSKDFLYQYPYGIVKREGRVVNLSIQAIIPYYQNTLQYSYIPDTDKYFWYNDVPSPGYPLDMILTNIQDLKLIKLSSTSFIISATIYDADSGFYRFSLRGAELLVKDRINGTYNNGVFQKYIDTRDPVYSTLATSQPGNFLSSISGGFSRSISSYGSLYPSIPIFYNIDPIAVRNQTIKISYFGFAINDVDLSENPCDNTLLVNFTNVDKKQTVNVLIDIPNYSDRYRSAKWDSNIEMFRFDFTLVPRLFTNNRVNISIYYADIYFSTSSLNDNQQLRVHSSFADQIGPLISNITRSPAVSLPSGGVIGWKFKIEDTYNGFKNGTIKIVSTIEPFSPIVFEIKPNSTQDIYQDEYQIEVYISPNCLTQFYYIYSIELVDNSYHTTFYSYQNIETTVSRLNPRPPITPLLDYINDENQSIIAPINVDCGFTRTDFEPPYVNYIAVSPETQPFDTFSNLRTVQVIFTVIDDANNILTSSFYSPYCYLEGLLFENVTTKATFVSNNGGPNSVDFLCRFNVPYGFGYPGPVIMLSIHGYYDTQMNIGGMAANDLQDAGMNPNIPMNYDSSDSFPVVEKIVPSEFTKRDTSITIVGHKFMGSTSIKVNIETIDGLEKYNYSVVPKYPIVIIVNNIKPMVKPFYLKVFNGGIDSNVLTITPTGEPFPPIPPCPGTPQCGGSSNGQCIEGVCQCIKPWSGVDCLSQNIFTPSPTINTTNPDIDNNFNTTLPDGESITLKSLISTVSLIELKPDGTIVIEHPFTQWVYTNTTSLQSNSNIQEFTYKTNITNNNLITPISVTLQYFKQPETIIFANEKLEMLASTIKYRIDISKYNFSSVLNTLQLVMSFALESQNSETMSCSVQESGDIGNTNSEYVKLQIDTHSLYGRFIKRGIIDNRIQQISNTIQNNNSSTSKSSQIFVGINIPNFRSFVVIDPDFSVLIDSTPASLKSNSICSLTEDTNESGLSKPQLAGIIIGCVGFGLVAIITISYILFKRRQYRKFQSNIQKKLDKHQNEHN